MTNIIVAFPKLENAKNIKNILTRNGFSVAAVCTSGAQAVNSADEFGCGVLVCGYQFKDMVYQEIFDCIPSEMRMLLLASPEKWSASAPEEIVCLGLPLKVHDLLGTMEMMLRTGERRKKSKRDEPERRGGKDQEVIRMAKALLMERNHMTEPEAHRYLQKCSMDSGTNLVETAGMIMSLMEYRG